MKRQMRTTSILRFLLPAVCLLLACSGLLYLGPKPGLYAPVATALCLIIALWTWRVYSKEIAAPRKVLIESQSRIEDGLEGLSSNLAKLSTGNLATKAPASTLPASISLRGELGAMARIAASTATLVRESIDAFNGITNEPCLRLCYVGSDSYAEGQTVGKIVGNALGGKGRVAVIVGSLQSVNHILRRKGAVSLLAEEYPGIEVVETIETFESGDKTYAASVELMKRFPDLGAIYVTEGATPSSAARAVVDAGRTGKTTVVSHDLTDETMEYVVQGIIAATVSQDPYAQGHDSIIRLYNHLTTGWTPSIPRFLTTLQEVRKDNYSRYWCSDDTLTVGDCERLAKVVEGRNRATPGNLRIAMVSLSNEGFWKEIYEGAVEAKRELEALGAKVEWMEPPYVNDQSLTAASTYAPIIERLISEKWNGLAIPIFDRNLVPTLNKAVHAGLAVVSYNSEPTSLREMVASVSSHAGALLALSQELAASAEESGKSTASIASTIGKITSSLRSQASETARTTDRNTFRVVP